MIDNTRKRPRMGEIYEPPSLNDPRHGRKRPLQGGQISLQAPVRQDPAMMIEDDSISSHTTDGVGLPKDLEDANTGRCPDDNGNRDFHVEKRSRTSDWPLRDAVATSEATCPSRVVLRDRYEKSNSASPPPGALVKSRPSKFVEGSMKDRASQKPHPLYTDDSRQSWTHFEADQNISLRVEEEAQPDGYMGRMDSVLVSNSRVEATKSFSIFRFGKSIAAAFNPSTWKMWSKQQEADSHENRVLTERHEKAEKVYKELKRTGQLRTSANHIRSEAQDKKINPDKHDSGVNFDECASWIGATHRIQSAIVEANMEEKRYGRVFLSRPRIDSSRRCESAASESSVSLNLYPQFPEPKHQVVESLNNPQALRRLPSRKDLQKQQKLVKRVSDLEGKLEAARRQLAEALGDPLPKEASRKNGSQVAPSTLSSLPSERLLGAHSASGSDLGETTAPFGIGKAISIDNRKDSHFLSGKSYGPPANDLINTSSKAFRTLDIQKIGPGLTDNSLVNQTTRKSCQELSVGLVATSSTAKKRKNLGAGARGSSGDYSLNLDRDDDNNSEAAESSIPKRGPGRPRKLQKTDPEPGRVTVDQTKAKESGEIDSALSFHGRNDKDLNCSLIGLTTKTVRQAKDGHIPQEVRHTTMPSSPSPSMPSLEITYSGTEMATGKTGVHQGERDDTFSVINPAITKLVSKPAGAIEPRRDALASNKITKPRRKIDVHGDGLDRKGPETLNTDAKKSKANSKQAFEWPADVF